MKINLILSSKVDANGMSEILFMTNVRAGDKRFCLRSRSGIYVKAEYFDDKRESGIVSLTNRRLDTEDVIYHRNKSREMAALITYVTTEYESVRPETIYKDWLKEVVERYKYPEQNEDVEKEEGFVTEEKPDFYTLGDLFVKKKKFSIGYERTMYVLYRLIARYEGFVRATQKGRKDFVFDYDTIDRREMENLREYILSEKELSEKYPRTFKRLLKTYPANIKPGQSVIEARGDSRAHTLMKLLKAFFKWMVEEGYTKNRPFEGFKLGSEKYSKPFYITTEERNIIAQAKMPTKHLETQRDVFVLQCLLGCRVSDLMSLTPSHIVNDIIIYTPRKTKDEGVQPVQARVPLTGTAKALIKKYEGVDSRGRIMPFISPQKYNEAIKEILTIAGINRMIDHRNSITGEVEKVPINEIASSHMARRTFIGGIYKKVKDPNLIGRMSGHVENSKAFARYRDIDDQDLRDTVKLLE